MAQKTWNGTGGVVGDWDDADNWTPSGVPANSDDVIFANSGQDVLDGLDQSAISLNSLTIDQSYTGRFGNKQTDFLEIGSSKVQIGQIRSTGNQTGSRRLNIDLGAVVCDVKVYNTASRGQDQDRMPVRFRANNAGTDFSVFSGSVGISEDTEDSSTIGDIFVNSGTVNIGSGVTLGDVITNGGSLNSQSSFPGTVNVKGGTLNSYDSITAQTINALTVSNSGIVNHFATGLITSVALNTGGTLDLTKTQEAKTITTITASGGTLITDTGTVTITNLILAANLKQTISFR